LRGGATEQAIMRFADAQMAFLTFLTILMVAALGGNALNLILCSASRAGWSMRASCSD
jgi:ABC-type dipeptide/oligopeptide/nickel transport system permease subunit